MAFLLFSLYCYQERRYLLHCENQFLVLDGTYDSLGQLLFCGLYSLVVSKNIICCHYKNTAIGSWLEGGFVTRATSTEIDGEARTIFCDDCS